MFHVFEASTADQLWQQLVQVFRDSQGVRVQPSRGGPTKEVLQVATSITDPMQRWVVSRNPPMNPAFALVEVVWIMTGRNDLAFLQAWNSRLQEYVGPGPTLHGAYGYRLRRHLGLDQLTRAFEALRNDADTRQVVLQIWDSSIDLPATNGSPADPDIPCNIASLLKVREDKLEWVQIIRSNDLFLGVPHNFVQFTCLQEIIAGWLNLDCGAYHQISDSLHLYERDETNVLASQPLDKVPPNTDSLKLPRTDSESAFSELARRIEEMIQPGLTTRTLERLSNWGEGPQAFRNMLALQMIQDSLDVVCKPLEGALGLVALRWARYAGYLDQLPSHLMGHKVA